MNPAILNHLWQSTLFALADGLFTMAFRKNHAKGRHWRWWAASVKFLLPFGILTVAASHIEIPHRASLSPLPAASAVVFELSEPFAPAHPIASDYDWLPLAASLVWALGGVALAARRVR